MQSCTLNTYPNCTLSSISALEVLHIFSVYHLLQLILSRVTIVDIYFSIVFVTCTTKNVIFNSSIDGKLNGSIVADEMIRNDGRSPMLLLCVAHMYRDPGFYLLTSFRVHTSLGDNKIINRVEALGAGNNKRSTLHWKYISHFYDTLLDDNKTPN